jgi:oxygen-independent coproporphyrinogen-3 oxidase
MTDKFVNWQRVRHGQFTCFARNAFARLLVGAHDWPPVFQQPSGNSWSITGDSTHLYVHIPFCRSFCPHCPYLKFPLETHWTERYRQALVLELRQHLQRHPEQRVHTLYFGGGTPSSTVDIVADVIALLEPRLSGDAQVGVEVHPLDVTRALLTRLKSLGVNRVSLGIETLDPRALRSLARGYTPQEAVSAIASAREADYDCLDANLIFGIAEQAPEQAEHDAQTCLELGVDQISAYPLFTFEHTQLGRRLRERKYPRVGERARYRAQRSVSRACRKFGFRRTSVWSFTRPGIAPYTTVTRDDYLGFGVGAGSKIDGTFWFNTFSLAEYCDEDPFVPALMMKVSPRMRRVHWLYWQLYSTRVSADLYRALFARHLKRDFGWLLTMLRLLGWLKRDVDGFRVTERGAVWGHRLQSLYSLSYIDQLWAACGDTAWPKKVVLDGGRFDSPAEPDDIEGVRSCSTLPSRAAESHFRGHHT